MTTSVVLFDYDGVVNFAPKMFSQRVIQRNPHLNLYWEHDLKPFFTEVLPLCKIGKKDLKNELSETPQSNSEPYFKLWGFENVDELLTFWFSGEQYPFDKIIDLIKKLKNNNIKCCLATNNEKHIIDYIKMHGVGSYFDEIFSSAESGYLKPQREFYEYVFNSLFKKDRNLKQSEIFYIDDEEENVNSAQRFGFKGFYMKSKDSFDSLENELRVELGTNGGEK